MLIDVQDFSQSTKQALIRFDEVHLPFVVKSVGR